MKSHWIGTRVLAVLLLAVFLLQMPWEASAAEEDVTPNIYMLEALLNGDRQWVLNTLLEDSREDNPMAMLYGTSGQPSMAQKALNTYRLIDVDSKCTAAVYRLMVDVMEKVYNKDDYKNGLLDETGNVVSWAVGIFPNSESLQETIDTLVTSTDELRYDRLLKSVFTASYQATNGDTGGTAENDIAMVRQIRSALAYLKTFISFAKTEASSAVGAVNVKEFNEKYINSYALPYADACTNYLNALKELSAGSKDPNDEVMVKVCMFLGLATQYAALNMDDLYGDFSYHKFLEDYSLASDTISTLKKAGKVVNIADGCLDAYLYINSLQQQKDALAGTMERITAAATDEDMKKSLQNFNYLMSEEYDNQILSYDNIVTYLRSNSSVYKYTSKMVQLALKELKELMEKLECYQTVVKYTNLVEVAAWVANEAVGFKDTCKKTYELLYWEKLKDLCVSQCRADIAAYRANPTEELAARTLDDLLVLQRLRLYGEKTAYGLSAAQLDSDLGQLFCGGETTQEGWKLIYQHSVDALLAASVVPPLEGLTVPAGESLSVCYREDVGYYGVSAAAGSPVKYYVELPARIAGGIVLKGKLYFENSSATKLAIGYLDAGENAVLSVTEGAVKIYELYQSGENFTAVTFENASLEVTGRSVLKNCTYASADGLPLLTRDAVLSGTVSGDTLKVTGDVAGSGAVVSKMELSGTERQTLSGTLTVGQLWLDRSDVAISGQVTVTDTIGGPYATVTNGQNICFTGSNIQEGKFNGSLSVKNAKISYAEFGGTLYDKGGTTYTGLVEVGGDYRCQGTSALDPNSRLVVRQSVWLAGNVLGGGGILDIYGDLGSSAAVTIPQKVNLLGNLPQQVVGDLTIGELNMDNKSTAGIGVQGTLTVTDRLENTDGVIHATSPVVLSDGGTLVGNTFRGDLSVGGYALSEALTIEGSLTARAGAELSGENLRITGTMIAPGALHLKNCRVEAGQLRSDMSLTLTDGAALSVSGSAACKGTLESGEPLSVGGNLDAQSLTCSCDLLVGGDLTAKDLTCTGTVSAEGDISTAGTVSISKLILCGKLPQHVTGSAFTVGDLSLRNTSAKGISAAQTITVTGRYENTGTAVTAGKIQGGISSTQAVTEDTVIHGNLVLSGDLSVTDCTLTVEGSLTLSGGTIRLSGGTLTVRDKLEQSGGSLLLENAAADIGGGLRLSGTSGSQLTVDASSALCVQGAVQISGCTVTDRGAMVVGGDLYLVSSPVSGSGQLTLKGDLASNQSIQTGCLTLSGLVRQNIQATEIHTGDLTLENPSGGGIRLRSKLCYSGTYLEGGTAVFGSGYLVKEDA